MTDQHDLQPRPIFVGGRWATSPTVMQIENPARPGEPAGLTYAASSELYDEAVSAAVRAFEVTRKLPSFERSAILRRVSEGIAARREELAQIITRESGKAIRDSLVETDRASFVFRLAAEEAERIHGEVIPLDLLPTSRGRWGITRRYPLGPVAAISPFNFPLNLAAHKVAPAMAAGCPVVLKPPSRDPLVMLDVAAIIEEAGAPPGSVSVLPMDRDLGDRMVEDDRFKLLTFTGSSSVGWGMKARAGKKKLVLELGGNGGVIVDATADLDWAVGRIATGSFGNAGQTCISVQRIFAHRALLQTFLDRFVAAAGSLKMGDPLNPATELGPMTNEGAALRAQEWVEEAVRMGGTLLCGGVADGPFFPPTILSDTPLEARVCSQEVFAPLVVVFAFDAIDDALAQVNATPYGLQAGIFTNDLAHAWRAFDELNVGGVILNDVPSYRIDHMPYGGTKDSGHGREGIRYAIEEMTEPRLLVIAGPDGLAK